MNLILMKLTLYHCCDIMMICNNYDKMRDSNAQVANQYDHGLRSEIIQWNIIIGVLKLSLRRILTVNGH